MSKNNKEAVGFLLAEVRDTLDHAVDEIHDQCSDDLISAIESLTLACDLIAGTVYAEPEA